MRSTDVQRDSRPVSHELFADKAEKARLEARNGLLQADEMFRLAVEAISSRQFRLRPSTIQAFQRLAIKDVYTCAGNYRIAPVSISGTEHQPPNPEQVPELVEEMCDYVNEHQEKSPLHLSAYVMWRVNWIHPFAGGNGRTSRASSYLVLMAKLGQIPSGTPTIPEQIVAQRDPYYRALDAADAAWVEGRVDVSVMEELLSVLLANQLEQVLKRARGD